MVTAGLNFLFSRKKKMQRLLSVLLTLLFFTGAQSAGAQANPKFDAEYAKKLGADKMGMRSYVLVVLKTGPNKLPPGKERDAMFAGHFSNMKRLAADGKLAVAGPFDGVDGWRGLFIFSVSEIEEARKLTETDPLIIQGEMVAEFHKWYSSAALMEVGSIHEKLGERNF